MVVPHILPISGAPAHLSGGSSSLRSHAVMVDQSVLARLRERVESLRRRERS